MRKICILILLLNYSCKNEVELSSKEVLEKSIQFHDPQNQWSTFQGELKVKMTTPESPERLSNIEINLPLEYFKISISKDSTEITYTLDKGKCGIFLNGSQEFPQSLKDSLNLNCERGNMLKNYYTYLYGLPMKLRDTGTNLSEKVETRTFKGEDYIVITASYDKSVGSDIWNFYLDPNTYELKVYQFFKTDDNQKAIPESGEYILLTETEEIGNILMPKVRKWYYNKDDKFLGVDLLH